MCYPKKVAHQGERNQICLPPLVFPGLEMELLKVKLGIDPN